MSPFKPKSFLLLSAFLLAATTPLANADGKCQINVSRDGVNADGCINKDGKWVPYNDELCAEFDYTTEGTISYQGNSFCTLDPILRCASDVAESVSIFGVYENLQIVNSAQGPYDFVFYTVEWETNNEGTVVADSNDGEGGGEFETFLVMSYLT